MLENRVLNIAAKSEKRVKELLDRQMVTAVAMAGSHDHITKDLYDDYMLNSGDLVYKIPIDTDKIKYGDILTISTTGGMTLPSYFTYLAAVTLELPTSS